jgi:hypothetical protein
MAFSAFRQGYEHDEVAVKDPNSGTAELPELATDARGVDRTLRILHTKRLTNIFCYTPHLLAKDTIIRVSAEGPREKSLQAAASPKGVSLVDCLDC